MAGVGADGRGGVALTLSAFNAFFFNADQWSGWICVALVVFASSAALARRLLGALLCLPFDRVAASACGEAGDAWLPYQVCFDAALPPAVHPEALVLVARQAAYPQALMKPYQQKR